MRDYGEDEHNEREESSDRVYNKNGGQGSSCTGWEVEAVGLS